MYDLALISIWFQSTLFAARFSIKRPKKADPEREETNVNKILHKIRTTTTVI